MQNRALVVCSLVASVLFSSPFDAAASAREGRGHGRTPYRTGELLVRFHGPAGAAEVARTLGPHGAERVAGANPSGWMLVRAGKSTAELLEGLGKDARIAAAEPNFTVESAADLDPEARTWTPDDTFFPSQWNLASMPRAWFHSRGEASAVVAVLDTGFHGGDAEAPREVLPGYDFVNRDSDPDDDNGHGTHIASIIVQTTDNARRAAGIAPRSALLPLKVLDADGVGTVQQLAEAIYFATDAGARVINLSLALPPLVRWSEVLHDAVVYASSRGVLLVAASGNHGVPLVCLPAAFNEVIAVGALASDGQRAAYSNWGLGLDLVAPGGDSEDRDADGHPDAIAAFSLDPETGQSGLFLGAGTSQAAAHVSGVAALLVALGETDPERLRSLLQLTAHNLPVEGELADGWDLRSGFGRIDPPAAIEARSSLPALAAHNLSGWVDGQESWATDPETGEVFGLIASHPSGLLVVIRDHAATYGLADAGGDSIALYRIDGLDPASWLGAEDGVLERLEEAGGPVALLEASGALLGTFSYAGGVSELVDASGGALGILEQSGGVLALVDIAGVVAALAEVGGVTECLNVPSALSLGVAEAGGLLGWVTSAGGITGLVGARGGIEGLVGDSGGLTGLVDANGASGLRRVE